MTEFELVCAYKGGTLLHTRSEYWLATITEYVILEMSMFLDEVYDTYQLWYVPPNVVKFARKLGQGI